MQLFNFHVEQQNVTEWIETVILNNVKNSVWYHI